MYLSARRHTRVSSCIRLQSTPLTAQTSAHHPTACCCNCARQAAKLTGVCPSFAKVLTS